jgi:hypothetical protein
MYLEVDFTTFISEISSLIETDLGPQYYGQKKPAYFGQEFLKIIPKLEKALSGEHTFFRYLKSANPGSCRDYDPLFILQVLSKDQTSGDVHCVPIILDMKGDLYSCMRKEDFSIAESYTLKYDYEIGCDLEFISFIVKYVQDFFGTTEAERYSRFCEEYEKTLEKE